MSRRKRDKQSSSSGEGTWLTTFADLMTLLLTFFVLLYSFSSIDNIKFKQMAIAMAKALNGTSSSILHDGNIGEIPVDQNPGFVDDYLDKDDFDDKDQHDEIGELYEMVVDFINQNDLKTSVTIVKEKRGVMIELEDKILFDPGLDVLRKESLVTLNKISDLLRMMDNEIVVEGHTDNLPTNHGWFKSNWELSVGRAVRVVRYLSEDRALNPERFSASGYSQYRPRATSGTPQDRQKNRRVNILILPTGKEADSNE